MSNGFLYYFFITFGIIVAILLFFMILNGWLTRRELQRKLEKEREAGERG